MTLDNLPDAWRSLDTSSRRARTLIASRLVPWLLTLALLGCLPTSRGGSRGGSSNQGNGTSDDDDSASDDTWNESDDSGNENPQNAEEVNAVWEGRLTITGTSELCDWDEEEDWPWTGDNDNYAVTVPHDGYLEAILDWDTVTDYDLVVYFAVPQGTASPDETVTNNADTGPESYLFEDESSEGDEIVFGIACNGGEEGEYTLEILWED